MPSQDEIYEEFDRRHKTIKQTEKEEAKHSAMSTNSATNRNRAYRGGNDEEDDEGPWALDELDKDLPEYEESTVACNNLFSNANPSVIENTIIEYLEKHEIESKVSDKKYKIKFDYGVKEGEEFDANSEHPENHSDPGVSICIR